MKTIWQPVLIIISFVFGCFCGSCSSIDDNSKQNIKDLQSLYALKNKLIITYPEHSSEIDSLYNACYNE